MKLKFRLLIVFSILFSFKGLSQEICSNGVDDDGDGLIDCEDANCSPFVGIIQNGDFEDTQPGCNTGFSNFNIETQFWDNAAGSAELFMNEAGCSFTPFDFLGDP